MPAFQGTDFQIELPRDFRDESTYAFSVPARSGFRPSVVVKTEWLDQPVSLSTYVEQQLDQIKNVLPDVTIVSKGQVQHGGLNALSSIYDWGEAPRRVRQKQRYFLLTDPDRVVTLTATNLLETFSEAESLLDAIFLSFKPIERLGKTK